MEYLNILKITRDDLDENNFYIGSTDVTNFDGSIEIAENLGIVRFKKSITASHRLRALSGSGIEAGGSIKAGWGIEDGGSIKAGGSIEAGWDIEAGSGIEAGGSIEAGWGIEAGGSIKAGRGIEAGSGIEAGGSIKAGRGIEAGGSIKAGSSIKAGLSISCKWIYCNMRIFAGICSWKIPSDDEMQIRGELRKGEIAFGKYLK